MKIVYILFLTSFLMMMVFSGCSRQANAFLPFVNTVKEEPFEYKEPDHAFFMVANHKRDGLSKERTEELITLPNDMAVVRYVTLEEQKMKSAKTKRDQEYLKSKGKKIVYYKTVLLDKRTNKETEIHVAPFDDDDGDVIVIDAMINKELTEYRCICVSHISIWEMACRINEKNRDNLASPLTEEHLVEYATVYFATPSLVRVILDLPEERFTVREGSLRGEREKKTYVKELFGMEYFVEEKRIKAKDFDGKDIYLLSSDTIWFNKKYYDYFHNLSTGGGIAGYNVPKEVYGVYKDMPRPEYDLSEWKGWIRMNFDRDKLIGQEEAHEK